MVKPAIPETAINVPHLPRSPGSGGFPTADLYAAHSDREVAAPEVSGQAASFTLLFQTSAVPAGTGTGGRKGYRKPTCA